MAAAPEPCDCPECSEQDVDPIAILNDLAAIGAELLTAEDPVEAELLGASILAVDEAAGADFREALLETIVPALEQSPAPESLALLVAIDAMSGSARTADAVGRLRAAGVPAPAWVTELSEPVTPTVCRRYSDPTGETSMLLCAFDRAGRSHGFVVYVDDLDCHAAADLILVPGDMLADLTRMIKKDARRSGAALTIEELDPAELRRQVERALDARAVHDREDGELDPDDLDTENGPGYQTLAALLRARMRALPAPPRPPAPHAEGGQPSVAELLGPVAGGRRAAAAAPKLPAKRTKSAGPAPIYQVKVTLLGARPPIWRRLELPGDTGLTEVHEILQTAFGWTDSHLHVFETPYGVFGVADPELGYRSERPVTLEQVAPGAGAKVRYLYDFGDDWDHEIVVEKLLDRQEVAYPRCTGGRRAAPPDDCGGIWGYQQLMQVLSDPGHPDHADRLDWLGLKSAAGFDPARFDAAEVTRELTERW
ncbi:hypothetical protein [Actinoplanes sp. L3-i22]|uniref:IS1096 element passenger TnpR family protein n=1 Tax=Actinoplanes sp. L3-i22 TaxID=2836373 RepID=UPI001C77C65F|nr:hypothetical protein [Actinoplanes sp. L3-i22]BCY11792.1 hypothetical protein L3i22_068800 [Actinoplanes sp. L3-i22]